MTFRFPGLTAVLFATLSPSLAGQQPDPALPVRPRLVVVCSVDQLATWLFEQNLVHLQGDGGFRRLLRQGTWFTACAYQHGCSETGPGHATLSTGAPASVHGIAKNQWWDRASGAPVYCVQELSAEALPELPEGVARGPGQLRAPTMGDSVKAHLGAAAKVVSVSWKDRSAILMAGGSADLAAWFEVTTGRLVTNKVWCDAVPEWIAAFNRQKVIDSLFGWRWDRIAAPEVYADLVDDRPGEGVHSNGSNARTLPQLVTGGAEGPCQKFYDQAFYSPLGNEMVLLAALAALEGEGLGRDDVPDLLCVSFSSTDTIGHQFGPRSVEARDALLRLDAQLARLLDALDQQVGVGRYVFLLSADHGVGPIPEAARAAGVDAGRGTLLTWAKAAAETALSRRFGSRQGKGPYVTRAGEMSLFLDPTAIAEQLGDGGGLAVASRVAAEAVLRAPGILTAFATDDLLAGGPGEDPMQSAMFFAAYPDRAGDVLLVFKPYWLDGITPASHGTPHAYDREVPLLAMGAGFAAGARCDAVVSPGLAAVLTCRVLGIPPPSLAVDVVPEGVLRK